MSDSPKYSAQERERRMSEVLMLARTLKMAEESERCAESLKEFLRAAWPVLGMGTPFVSGWHVDALCEHMEALLRRDIRKLIINISPRSLKSVTLSVAASAWRWINVPEEKFLTSSYTMKLSLRDSRFARNLIRSKWYQERWGGRFAITKDQNEKGRFENDKGGYRIATATDSTTIGEGGAVRIFDDPNDLNTINSKVEREKALDYYRVMATRAVDPKTDVELCVQQRGHPDDVTGYLLSLGGWELLTIPMEFEGESKPSSIGWRDPRTHVGELMHPERFGAFELDALKRTLGPAYAGQFQQRPAAEGGNLLKREYWKFWNPAAETLTAEQRVTAARPVQIKIGAETVERQAVEIPAAFEQVVQSWDMAFKDMEQNDYVAGHAWGRMAANCYLLARDHGHKDFPKTCAAVRRMSLEFPTPEKLIEEKANGAAVIQTLRNEIPGLIPINDAGGKVARVSAISGYVEAGNVFLPNPNLFPWVWGLLDEFSDFPAVKHDDDTDAMSQALRRLFDSVANHEFPEFRVQPRMGEPASARHIEANLGMALQPHWRRWIAVSPGSMGCALWFCETPSGGLRIYREADLGGMDALAAGKIVARLSLPDVQAYLESIHPESRWSIGILMEKEAFAPIEPVGSYAALLEQGLSEYVVEDGQWEDREYRQSVLRNARFNSDMVTLEGSSTDRFRALLQFQPPDFEEVEYDRNKSIKLLRENGLDAYVSYMNAVEGKVTGDWPKLRVDASCRSLISAFGSAVRGADIPNPYIRAALIGTSAAPVVKSNKLREVPYFARQNAGASRRFAMR